jgi:hypothetical protein
MKSILKSLAVLLIIIACGFNVKAQKPPIKFGEVSREELGMTDYPKEPGAEAVILCDFSIISLDIDENDIHANYNHTRRVKIFNKEGYGWATFSIPLYKNGNDKEIVSGLKGFTYNLENGKPVKSKLEKSSIFTEKVTDKQDRLKFTMPDVKEGSVIEFTYTKSSDFLGSIDPWYFQKSIPVQWSELYFKVPEYYNYLHISGGFENFFINENSSEPKTLNVLSSERDGRWVPTTSYSSGSLNYTVYTNHWAVKDMPSLKNELYVGNLDDYRQKMEFQLASTNFNNSPKNMLDSWESVNTRLLEKVDNFGPNMAKKGFYKDALDTLINDISTPTDKALAITRFVNDRIKWNDVLDYLPEKNIKKVFEDGVGSSAEINALLISMLRSADIDAEPVIISTRNHGQIQPVYPLLGKYNHLIAAAWIGDKVLLLDATDDDVPPGVLPDWCLNQTGRCISEKHNTWVKLDPVKIDDNLSLCNLTLKDDKLTGTISIKKTGYASIDSRSALKNDGEEKYIEKVKKDHPEWTITKYALDNTGGTGADMKEKYDIETSSGIMNTGDMIYIDPIILERLSQNPLKNETRKFPVDIGAPVKRQYKVNLIVPGGYIVEELPKSLQYSTPDKSSVFKYLAQMKDSLIQVTTSFEIKKGFYLPEEYSNLREFFSMVVQKNNEQIIIKKKQ